MTEQMALTLASASAGFVAATCFCLSSSFLGRKKVILLAATYFDYNKEQAIAIISQSAQHLIGALFLVVAFGLQVAATQASQASLQCLPPALESACVFVSLVLLSSSLLAFGLFHVLMLRQPSILKELEEG